MIVKIIVENDDAQIERTIKPKEKWNEWPSPKYISTQYSEALGELKEASKEKQRIMRELDK